jgi:hypothetical protein
MNGYVEAGYVVVLGTLGTYGVTLVVRERAARRRVGQAVSSGTATGSSDPPEAGVPAAGSARAGGGEETGPGTLP